MTQARIVGNLGDSLSGFSNTDISFDSNTLYIDSVNNRVGFGTSTPTQMVDIVGSANISGTLIASALNNCFKTDSSVTLSVGDYCVANANNLILTLPPTPNSGNYVLIGVMDFSNTVIGRNGSNIMRKSENLTIDIANTNIGLTYIDTDIGWKIV